MSPVPVIGVIEPTIKEAVKMTKTSHIGVIGTRATVASKMYEEEIHSLHYDMQITAKACPLFVPLAEEGWFDHPASRLIADEYLKDLKDTTIDTLILGCTHYPLLKTIIQEAVGEKIKLIDSARPTADALKQLLEDNNLLRTEGKPEYRFFVTDSPTISERTAHTFFNGTFPGRLEKVTLA
jgi:glutamate racemase